MPHQCVHCGKIIEVGSREILEGCNNCHGKFFFYIKDEKMQELKEKQEEPVFELAAVDKKKVEKDVREILKVEDDDKPVILNLESIRVTNPGKYELDLVSLMNRKPIVFKVEEGKYIIDLESLPRKEEDL